MPKIDTFLTIMREAGASDLHLSAGAPPVLRINGALQEVRPGGALAGVVPAEQWAL